MKLKQTTFENGPNEKKKRKKKEEDQNRRKCVKQTDSNFSN